MAIKYYRDDSFHYLGAFEEAPDGGTEVATAPLYASQTYNDSTEEWEGMAPNPPALTAKIAYEYGINNDPDVPYQIFMFFDPVRWGAYSATLRLAVWARLKADDPEWLTQAFKDKFVAWASAAGCPVE